MTAKVQRWGNSLALRIPKLLAKDIHVYQGSEVELFLKEGRILIEPKRKKKFSLGELIKKVTKENVHSEQNWGGRTGAEVW